MKVLTVAGARPNFVKIAPLMKEMRRHSSILPILVHTGQHYDRAMSDQFFADLEIAPPDVNLGAGSGSHAEQTGQVMQRIEPVLEKIRPDLIVVVGDVNSTMAATLVAAKLGIPVAHVEAGLRSFDRGMPEEINRIVTDALADMLFVTEESGRRNLLREGIDPWKIHFVGNVMIDALEATRTKWERSGIFERLGIEGGRSYVVLTLHRPSNVDDGPTLAGILAALQKAARRLPIILPVHPRTRPKLPGGDGLLWHRAGSAERLPDSGILCVDPMSYLDFVALTSRARLVLTDSGGVQEESTVLGVPCLTLRETTERPVTVSHGTNRVIGTGPARIVDEVFTALSRPPLSSSPPPLWDGKAAERVVKILLESFRMNTRQAAVA
jgi:UDP-N-acetylglucosamine 2-epimerase (non-hydrolysing)